MNTEQLTEFFESNDFNVHPFEQDNQQCAEVEKWTDGGVDMIITLMPFTKENFIKYVADFDVDEQIDLHRDGQLYKDNFTIKESLIDFTDFHKDLKKVVKMLK